MPAAGTWHGRRVGGLEACLVSQWYRPRLSVIGALLLPASAVYRLLLVVHRAAARRRARQALPVPVIVVGNLVAGGAGKTPVVIALVQALQAAGRRPGIVSRGHGRTDTGVRPVLAGRSTARDVGDEPLLIARRTEAPVWVGRDRCAAAHALLAAHPEVDMLVSDDGLQHHRLPRDLEILVFDGRGVGNGHLLPAGPLREPFRPADRPAALVLYNHPAPTTAWPGRCATAGLHHAVPLASWQAGHDDGKLPIEALRARRCLAMAGIAAPERFFAMLEAAGLQIERLALPDHHDHAVAAWPADASEVVTTEKDAVKLTPPGPGGPRIWVVPLDFRLPDESVAELLRRLVPRPPT